MSMRMRLQPVDEVTETRTHSDSSSELLRVNVTPKLRQAVESWDVQRALRNFVADA